METHSEGFTLEKVRHRESDWWAIFFPPGELLNSKVRALEGRRWSAALKVWLVPSERFSESALRQSLGGETTKLPPFEVKKAPVPEIEPERKPEPVFEKPAEEKSKPERRVQTGNKGTWVLSKENQRAKELYHRELVLKGYSPNTILTYENEFQQFLATLRHTPAESLPSERVKDYLFYCLTKLKLSEATIHSRMNALKFYYEQVLHRERFFFDIPRPKKRIQLPKVISEEKILMGIEKLKNQKHRVLIMAAYSAGLRVSEVVNLKITDIQSDRMQILIRQSKGKKDRMVPLSKVLLDALRNYFKQYKPKDWLFEGQFPGTSLSTRTAQEVFNQVYKSLGLPKGITFHSLRHSYATHLVESGIDVTFVQHLLGHNDVRTTLRYTHVSQKKINNIESPLDRALRLKNEKENEK
jgi:integrase/recombinase XerD